MSQKNKSIQEKTADLAKIVAWFDSEEFSLEEAINQFKRAEDIANDIESDLLSLKNEITLIKQKIDSEN